MYIQNQEFSDSETLIDMLFDFELGNASPWLQTLKTEIDAAVSANQAFTEFVATLTDEEERMEVQDEERRLQLAALLQEQFTAFEVKNNTLLAKNDKELVVLYEIDLY
jgi:septal ring factor EnvC (AmiA/AmiB activator)